MAVVVVGPEIDIHPRSMFVPLSFTLLSSPVSVSPVSGVLTDTLAFNTTQHTTTTHPAVAGIFENENESDTRGDGRGGKRSGSRSYLLADDIMHSCNEKQAQDRQDGGEPSAGSHKERVCENWPVLAVRPLSWPLAVLACVTVILFNNPSSLPPSPSSQPLPWPPWPSMSGILHTVHLSTIPPRLQTMDRARPD